MRERNEMRWEGSPSHGENVHFLMCRPRSGAKNSPSRGWETAEFPKSQFRQPLGALVQPGWGKHPGHHLTSIPVSLEEAAKALGGIQALARSQIHTILRPCWHCSHAQGHCKGSGLQPAPRHCGEQCLWEQNPVFPSKG